MFQTTAKNIMGCIILRDKEYSKFNYKKLFEWKNGCIFHGHNRSFLSDTKYIICRHLDIDPFNIRPIFFNNLPGTKLVATHFLSLKSLS